MNEGKMGYWEMGRWEIVRGEGIDLKGNE